jgi:hypothetical protein
MSAASALSTSRREPAESQESERRDHARG